jgi:hypothetical protein
MRDFGPPYGLRLYTIQLYCERPRILWLGENESQFAGNVPIMAKLSIHIDLLHSCCDVPKMGDYSIVRDVSRKAASSYEVCSSSSRISRTLP